MTVTEGNNGHTGFGVAARLRTKSWEFNSKSHSTSHILKGGYYLVEIPLTNASKSIYSIITVSICLTVIASLLMELDVSLIIY